eukprot:5265327-Amphidinium_carterae.1
MALQHASPELRNDRVIVHRAVSKNGIALEYAGEEMRRDRDIVLTAIAHDEFDFALSYAADTLLEDMTFAAHVRERLLEECCEKLGLERIGTEELLFGSDA